ncbi:MAG: flagellar M-ring protein FliF [Deltaproteobacteria bacterium]|nr:flagellar M-ring protein FliF [Deltaproteobacteria bacterium]
MADIKLNETFQQIKTLIVEMPFLKKLSILITVGVSVAILVFLGQLSGKSEYQVLFSNLETEDITAIATALDKYNVEYQIQSDSKAILVPGSKVLETRIKLSKDGLPKYGGVGFEIFDKNSFGMTDFEQRLNYQRALQGELQRTINEFMEIEDSRVHLVVPQESVFLKDKEGATASIILKLEAGEKIREETVRSIVHLVSTSVSNLDASKVTVVTTDGSLLTADNTDGDAMGGAGGMQKKSDLESAYEQKVRSLLEPIVGFGKIRVKVTADLDFTSKETTEEKYDPDSIAVRNETRTRNKESEETAGEEKQAAGAGKQKDVQTETMTYEVSKQIQHINHPTGNLKNLSVAVIIDGVYQKNEDGTTAYAARTPEEIQSFEDIIKSAVGFNQARGDQIRVMNLAFQNPETLFAQQESSSLVDVSSNSFYLGIIVNVVIAMIAILIILFVIRPVIGAWNVRRRDTLAVAGMGAGFPALAEGGQKMLTTDEAKMALEKKAATNPGDMVEVLKKWLE